MLVHFWLDCQAENLKDLYLKTVWILDPESPFLTRGVVFIEVKLESEPQRSHFFLSSIVLPTALILLFIVQTIHVIQLLCALRFAVIGTKFFIDREYTWLFVFFMRENQSIAFFSHWEQKSHIKTQLKNYSEFVLFSDLIHHTFLCCSFHRFEFDS